MQIVNSHFLLEVCKIVIGTLKNGKIEITHKHLESISLNQKKKKKKKNELKDIR